METPSEFSSSAPEFHAPEIDFLNALRSAGLDYAGPIIADGVLHRFKVNGDRNPNSFYVLHLDGIAAGHFGCWKRNIKENWCAVSNEVLTAEQRAERDRKWKAQQAERDAERRRQQNEAAIKAQAILDGATPATNDHPYLAKKGVPAYPGVMIGAWPQRQADHCLMIPLRTADGLLATVQAISASGELIAGSNKDFLKGGSTKGAHFVMGDLQAGDTVIIAEGYATAATLFEATGYPAVMAIDSGNLKPVAEILKKLHPQKRFIIASDNDRKDDGTNPGVKAATAAAKAIKAALAIPQFADGEIQSWRESHDKEPTDFNDLAALHGLDAVRAAIEAAGRSERRTVVNDEAGWRLELMRRADSDQLLKNHYNAVMIVENAYPGLVGYNEFRQRIEARIPSPWRKEPGQWTDADTGELAFHLAKEFTSFTLDALSAAVMTVAYRHRFNPAQERLRSLSERWDGEARLESWLIEYLGAAANASNSAYLAEIGAAWMKGVAARVLFPGCKRDDVLVTRGEQGIGKSTAAACIAEAISPDAFTDSLGNLDSKDSKAAIRGIIIAELGELSVLNKSDLESVKVYVATRTDHFREAYGRGERDYPRTVSFIGTTNHPTFLKDPTGNRRFWPVTIDAPINIPRFKEILPQLLGEAARRVLNGEPWFVSDRAALAQANEVRAAHYQDDVWTESALNAAHRLLSPGCTLDGANPEFVTVSAILGAMGVRIEQQTVQNQMRIGGVLRVAGWTDRRKRIGNWKEGTRVVAWYPPNPVHPETLSTHPVHPPTISQTAGCPPCPPCPPYFEDLVKMEEGKSHGSSDSHDVSEFSAPTNYPFYGNRVNQGGQGGQSGKQRVNPVHPPCPPTQQGGQSPVSPPLPAEPRPLTCTWRPDDGRLITKCGDPDLQRDESGQVVCCANCGSASAWLAGGGA